MSKALNLDEYRDSKYKGKWLVQNLICLKCRHRHISVHPDIAKLRFMQCPNCGQVGFIIATGQALE